MSPPAAPTKERLPGMPIPKIHANPEDHVANSGTIERPRQGNTPPVSYRLEKKKYNQVLEFPSRMTKMAHVFKDCCYTSAEGYWNLEQQF